MGEPGHPLQQQLASLQLQVAQLIASKAAPALSCDVIPYDAAPGRRLDGTNYSDWAHQLRSSLVGRGLLQLVLNAEPEPVDATAADAARRQQRLNIAYAMITTQLDPTVRDWIGDEETNPQVVWKRLADRFDSKDFNKTSVGFTSYFQSSFLESESAHDFLARLTKLRRRITTTTMQISDECHIWRILDSLPPSYLPLATALRVQKDNTVDYVEKAVIDFEGALNKGAKSSPVGPQALAAAGQRTDGKAHSRKTNGSRSQPSRGNDKAPRHRDRHDTREQQRRHSRSPARDSRNRGRDRSRSRSRGRSRSHSRSRSRDRGRDRSRSRASNKPRGDDFDENKYCTHCERQGHDFASCRARHKVKANVATTSHDDDDPEPQHAFMIASAASSSRGDERSTWYLDTGASQHFVCDRSYLHHFVTTSNTSVFLGDNRPLRILGYGVVRAGVVINGVRTSITLDNVALAPELAKNLLSPSRLAESGHAMHLDHSGCRIVNSNTDTTVVVANHRAGMLVVPLIVERIDAKAAAATTTVSLAEMHRRLGHIGRERLIGMVRAATDLKGATIDDDLGDCLACVKGKLKRTTIGKGPAARVDRPMAMIHSDVCGPFDTQSVYHKRYFVSFIDDYSRFAHVYFMAAKDEVFAKFKEFIAASPHRLSVHTLRSDNGGEYTSREFQAYLEQHGISHQPAPPHTPEYNGVAERFNGTIIGMARSMLADADIPRALWPEAVATAVYVNNRAPTRANRGRSPFELWRGIPPAITHLHPFGAQAYQLDDRGALRKLDDRARPVRYLGPTWDPGQHRLWVPTSNTVTISRNVKFVDHHKPTRPSAVLPSHGVAPVMPPGPVSDGDSRDSGADATLDHDDEVGSSPTMSPIVTASDEDHSGDEHAPALDPVTPVRNTTAKPKRLAKRTRSKTVGVSTTTAPTVDPPPRRSGRTHKAFNPYGDDFDTLPSKHHPQANVVGVTAALEPTSFKEAVASPDNVHWLLAMQEEMRSIRANNTTELVPRPPGCRTVGARWLFKIKYKADGSVDKYKARWVAKGYSQQQGIDYDATYAPVVRIEHLRLLLAYATALDLAVHQMDVVTAFLQAELKEVVYVEQPEGFESPDKPNHVCRLRRSLYGLKQAPLAWNQTLDGHLRASGFVPVESDPCVYVKGKGRDILIISVYVDDCLLIAADHNIDKLKSVLANRFKMKDLGPVHSILGIEVIRDEEAGTLQLRQRGHILGILDLFGMKNSAPNRTPLPVGLQLAKIEKTPDECKQLPYRSAIGKLLYVAIASRPDISYAVTYLCRFNTAYDLTHWNAVKHLLRYLKGTIDTTIKYERPDGHVDPTRLAPIAYCDADHAGDVATRKSISAYLFQLAGGPISWNSSFQKVVSLSSTEAEYVALTHACKQAVFGRKILGPLGLNATTPTTIYCDSQSAIAIATSAQLDNRPRLKHFDVKIHFIREMVNTNTVRVIYRSTNNMLADYLTKSLARPTFERLTTASGLTIGQRYDEST